jgi:uncharacterized damage-inducible protein DinB
MLSCANRRGTYLSLQAFIASGDDTLGAVTNFDNQGRPEAPSTGSEVEILVGFLEFQRATFEWKCAGLDRAGLMATVAPSSMTLGGMLKHLANVEDYWCSQWLHGNSPQSPWDTVNWDADPDWDWHSASDDSPAQIRALWTDSVDRSRSLINQALAEGGLQGLAKRATPLGQSPSLRWILCHLVEEYARHNGHADFLRESVDGQTGE